MTFPVTSLYAAAIALLAMALAAIVIVQRGRSGVDLGDGGSMPLLTAMRRHGNLLEMAPLALILLALNEAGGMAPAWLHAAGLSFIVLRLVHPFGLGAGGFLPARILGAGGSIAIICLLALALLLRGL